jgi:hypothetical protein
MVVQVSATVSTSEVDVALQFVGKDPNSGDGECPSLWFDEDNQEFVVQGWKAGTELKAKCLETGSVPDTEAVVRLPVRMASLIREVCDVAERAGAHV